MKKEVKQCDQYSIHNSSYIIPSTLGSQACFQTQGCIKGAADTAKKRKGKKTEMVTEEHTDTDPTVEAYEAES